MFGFLFSLKQLVLKMSTKRFLVGSHQVFKDERNAEGTDSSGFFATIVFHMRVLKALDIYCVDAKEVREHDGAGAGLRRLRGKDAMMSLYARTRQAIEDKKVTEMEAQAHGSEGATLDEPIPADDT